jgi:Tfp pilus assembly protein PilF
VGFAVSLGRRKETARQAERQFAEAIRLDPDNIEAHLQFGLYYKSMKVASRAIAELRTVLRLDPENEKARKELESAAPRDSVLVTFSKLLG